jgi:hypothetical protein
MRHLDAYTEWPDDVYVRTTLTLDPDVARLVDEAVHRARTSRKQVTNDALEQPAGLIATLHFRVRDLQTR